MRHILYATIIVLLFGCLRNPAGIEPDSRRLLAYKEWLEILWERK